MNAAKPAKAATAGLLVAAAPWNASGDVELEVEFSTGTSGWPSGASVTTGTLGTVVLAGVTSGVLSIAGVVGVTSVCGEVVQVPFTSPGVVTTTGVERAGILASVSVFSTGVGVVITAVGVWEIFVSSVIGVGAGVQPTVIASFSADVVLVIMVGVSETVVSVDAGVGAKDLASVQVSSPVLVPELGRVVFIGYVEIEWVMMVKVCVIGTVFGISLIVITVLFTG